jgi:outer membrane protein OmpA-like peptidoglycan-associated protein
MTGLYLVDAGDGWLQELLFQKLNTPLQAGSRYRLSLFIHFRSMDAYYPQQINFNFTDKDPCGIPISEFPPNYNSIPLKDSSLNDSVWIQVSSEFIAKSNDNFLVIGSFVPSSPLTKKKGKRVNHGVYIFLDEISLENLESGFLVDTIVQAIAIQENPQPKLQERTVLSPNLNPILTEKLESFSAIPSISFNHNSSELSTVYQKILSEIAPVLKEGNCQIIISGHTDNTGDEDFNKALSKRRAKVVADFLGKLGLDTNRIIIHGFSSQEPVAAGIDEFSRSLNRRVEIVKKCN